MELWNTFSEIYITAWTKCFRVQGWRVTVRGTASETVKENAFTRSEGCWMSVWCKSQLAYVCLEFYREKNTTISSETSRTTFWSPEDWGLVIVIENSICLIFDLFFFSYFWLMKEGNISPVRKWRQIGNKNKLHCFRNIRMKNGGL